MIGHGLAADIQLVGNRSGRRAPGQHGYGAGLINTLAPLLMLPVALGIFALQLWLSARWLRTHPYGPMEWLLRAATLWAWPNWRRTA